MKTLWNTQHEFDTDQQAVLDSLRSLPRAKAVASAFLAEIGEAQIEKRGYRRDKRVNNLQAVVWKLGKRHSDRHWEDHGVPLRHTDGHRAYLCEPYGLGLDDLKEIVRVAEALNLEVSFWQGIGCWNPASTTTILLKEKV